MRNILGWRARHLVLALLAMAVAATSVLASGATAKPKDQVTLRFMSTTTAALAANILAGNFMRVFPDIPGRSTTFSVLYLSDAGFLLDLAGRKLEQRMTQQQLVGDKVGKHVYAYSTGASLFVLHYNLDLFKQLGLSLPKTWSQFVDLCKKITAAGKIPVSIAPGDAVRVNQIALSLVGNDVYAKDPKWNVKRAHGEVTFANSGWLKTLQRIAEMKNAGCFSPGAAGTASEQAPALFDSGQALMYYTGTHSSSLFPHVHIGLMPTPPDAAGGKIGVVLNPTNYIAVNAAISGAQKEAALKFVDFIARPKQSDTFNRAVGMVFSGYDAATGHLPVKEFPALAAVAPYVNKSSATNPQWVWPNTKVAAALAVGIAGLFTGQKTPEQVVADMDAAFNLGRL
jgi:raffinose/stachyose/melibiose transport system substrate-binding protein